MKHMTASLSQGIRNRAFVHGCFVCSLFVCFAATAQTEEEQRRPQAYLTAFGEYTDNIARSFDNETSALVYGAGVGFDINTRRQRLEATLQGDVAYLASTESDLYEEGVVGNALGRLEYAIVPERFDWFVDGAYGQIPVDERLTDTPENRQDFSTLRTGPQFSLPLGTRNLLQFGGSYATTNYSVAEDDFDRTEGFLSLRRRLSARQSVALSGTSNKTEFEREDEFISYRQDRAFLEWSATGARTTLLAQAGYEVLNRDGLDDADSSLYKLRVTRKIGRLSTLTFDIDQQMADTSTAFASRIEFGGGGGAAIDVSPTAGVYRVRSAKTHFRTGSPQLLIDISATYEEDRYVDDVELQQSDRDIIFSSASILKTLSPTVVVGMYGDVTDADFFRQDFQYTEWNAGLLAAIRLTRSIGLQLSAARNRRSGGADDGGFKENIARISIYYGTGDLALDLSDRAGRR
jgi:hypothetical protein